MSTATIIGNGTVVTAYGRGDVLTDGAVVWRDDRIVGVGTADSLRREWKDARFVDVAGALIAPGLVNLHHHFYSQLARGLDPGAELRTFVDVLDRLWWRLDRALDPDTVRLSAQLAAADCIRWGCTTVFDHHASPSCIRGSLNLIAEAIERAGLSAVLCYEITDRNGHAGALEGLEENLDFIAARSADPRVRGTVGLHASFTLRDETLAAVAERRPAGVGCHIHVAEDPVDLEASTATFGSGPIQRLERFGLLDDRALLAHGIHLAAEDYGRVAECDAALIHNPDSNANNGVGYLDPVAVAEYGCLVGLGTDGMSSAMLRALRSAFLRHRDARRDPAAGFAVLPDLLANNALLARRFLDEPLLGTLAPGAPADIAVVDAPPPTPVSRSNLLGHLVYGAAEAPVRHVIARGRFLLENGRHTTVDPAELAVHARRVSPGLWERFAALQWGTNFLGD